MKEREFAIDIVKFLAVLLIIRDCRLILLV